MLNMKHILVYVLPLAALVLARPGDGGGGEGNGCLTDQDAYAIIHTFISFFEAGFDPAIAEQSLTEDFFEQSGGFNFITAQPVCVFTA
jgi:hypothetical protein